MSTDVIILTNADAADYQALRLAGLQEASSAFASSFEEECDRPLSWIESRLVCDDMGAVWGAFRDTRLVGITGLRREGQKKLAHKAFLWGVYVDPEHRQHSVGRQVVSGVLEYAFETMKVRQVNLGVNDANTAAKRLYESLGFRTFGLEEGDLVVDGVFHNERLMVLTRSGSETA